MKDNPRRSLMVLTALLVLISLFAVPTNVQAVNTIYYVNCATGNDSNNGLSPSTAWRTTTRANQQTYTAGDQILFARGTVCSGAAFKPVGNGAVGVPPPYGPMDFAGWFEAYLEGGWFTFDPRNNVPRIGRVLIARGRDAADVALTTTFGPNTLSGFRVWTDEVSGVLS